MPAPGSIDAALAAHNAEAALAYYRLDVSTFLFRGFDQLRDAVEYGQDLLPRIRALVEQQGSAKKVRNA